MYYLCCENKGADQLRGDHAADLHLCFFRICKRLILKPLPLSVIYGLEF